MEDKKKRPRFTTKRSQYNPGHDAQRVWSSDDKRNFGEDRPYNSEQRPFRSDSRPHSGEGRPYPGDRPARKPYGKPGERAYGKPAGERSFNKAGGERPYKRKPAGASKPYGTPKPYGAAAGKKPFRKKTDFTDTESEGIRAMIRRRPQVESGSAWSGSDSAKTPIQDVVRLNKFIANSGICSRREADTFIQSGVVTVNGEVVTELGTKINVLMDDVRFNGERLRGEEKVYIVMNKPKGFVTTASDPHADKTVMDLLKNCPMRVFPVGRLDKGTTGVLMFTNDGEMAEKLTHPSYNKKKIYQVILDQPLRQEDLDKILEGIDLADGPVRADELEYIDAEDHRKLGIEIHSGKNRIVRRIFETLGYEVRALDRVYFAGLTKKGLKKGEWRYLTEGEVNVLKMGAYV